MSYIKIKNNGHIDPFALHLVGASTKVDDHSKIGQFGSGNKYALAFLLRNLYNVKIYSGIDEIKITTELQEHRDNIFELIYINGEKTSITTQMGKDWKLWQSLREIICNAIDEGGFEIDCVDDINPIDGETHFYIEKKEDINNFMSNYDDYFSHNKKVLFESPIGRILEKSGDKANIYRKGIRCFETNKTSVFDYDFNEITIDENRLIKYFWTVEENIWQLIFNCDNKDVIIEALKNSGKDNTIEGMLSDISNIKSKMSPEFIEVIEENVLKPKNFIKNQGARLNDIYVPSKIYKSVSDGLDNQSESDFLVNRDGSIYYILDPSPEQSEIIKKIEEFFNDNKRPLNYPINLAEFDKPNILGSANNETILISEKAIERGFNDLCITVLEEDIHLSSGYDDETRDFQTEIISQWIDYMKNINSKF